MTGRNYLPRFGAKLGDLLGLLKGERLERPNTDLLLLVWDCLVDDTEGFHGSPLYQEWRRLLNSFCESFPVVEHFEQVHSAQSASDNRLRGRRETNA